MNNRTSRGFFRAQAHYRRDARLAAACLAPAAASREGDALYVLLAAYGFYEPRSRGGFAEVYGDEALARMLDPATDLAAWRAEILSMIVRDAPGKIWEHRAPRAPGPVDRARATGIVETMLDYDVFMDRLPDESRIGYGQCPFTFGWFNYRGQDTARIVKAYMKDPANPLAERRRIMPYVLNGTHHGAVRAAGRDSLHAVYDDVDAIADLVARSYVAGRSGDARSGLPT